MYFDFEDYRPDISPVGSAISWREGVLLSIIVHLVGMIVVLVAPKIFPFDAAAARARQLAVERSKTSARRRGSCSSSRASTARAETARRAARPPTKIARHNAVQRAKEPANQMPFSRGNTPERVEQTDQQTARGQGPQPDPAAGQQARVEPQPEPAQPDNQRLPDSQSTLQLPSNRQPQTGLGGRAPTLRRLARRRAPEPAALRAARSVRERAGRRRVRSGDPVRHQGRRVRSVDPPLHRAGEAQLVDPVRGDVDEGARRRSRSTCTRTARSPICRWSVRRRSTRSTPPRSARSPRRIRRAAAARVPVGQGVLHRHVLLQRRAAVTRGRSSCGLVAAGILLRSCSSSVRFVRPCA